VADEIQIRPDGLINVLVRSCAGVHAHKYVGTVESAINDFPMCPIFSVDPMGKKTILV
jgi:prophage DNA circulation protein